MLLFILIPFLTVLFPFLLKTIRLYQSNPDESFNLLFVMDTKSIYGWHTLTYLSFNPNSDKVRRERERGGREGGGERGRREGKGERKEGGKGREEGGREIERQRERERMKY